MLDLGYVGGILGTSLGLLGAITGVLGTLAKANPEKYLNKLRAMFKLDIGVGLILALGGLLVWFGSRNGYGYDLAETLFYCGVLTLVLLGMAYSEFFNKWDSTRRFIHLLLFFALFFFALGAYSHVAGAAPARKVRELSWGATLLIMYIISFLVMRARTKRSALSAS